MCTMHGIPLEHGRNDMVSVTGKARRKLMETLREQSGDPDKALRLVVAPSLEAPLGFIVDDPEAGDRAVTSEEGATLLLVGPVVAAALRGVLIDYEDSPEGERFTLSQTGPVN